MGGWMTACMIAPTEQSWMNTMEHKKKSSSVTAQEIGDGQQHLLMSHVGRTGKPSTKVVDTESSHCKIGRMSELVTRIGDVLINGLKSKTKTKMRRGRLRGVEPVGANSDSLARPRPESRNQTNNCCGPSDWAEVVRLQEICPTEEHTERDFDLQQKQDLHEKRQKSVVSQMGTMMVNTSNEHYYAMKLQYNQKSKFKLRPRERC